MLRAVRKAVLSWPDSPRIRSKVTSDLSQVRSTQFISFPDPSISIPHYPQTFIYPIHPNTLVPFTLKPSILPALCCHCLMINSVWITEHRGWMWPLEIIQSIQPNPKSSLSAAPCTIPPIPGLLAPNISTCSSAPLPLPIWEELLPPAFLTSTGCQQHRHCLSPGHSAWLSPDSTVWGGFTVLHCGHWLL